MNDCVHPYIQNILILLAVPLIVMANCMFYMICRKLYEELKGKP